MRIITLIVPKSMTGKSVKAVLRQELKMANAFISRIKLRERGILLNGERTRTNSSVVAGDILTVEIGDLPLTTPIVPSPMPLTILFEDEDLLIIDKPAGLPTHGAINPDSPTLANVLAAHLGSNFRFHPVNRLDKGTSGIMVIAKNGYIHDRLRAMFHTENFKREYYGISVGLVTPNHGEINLPIEREDSSIVKRKIALSGKGKESLTLYQTVLQTKHFSLLHLIPITGRTHQLRLHLSAIGYPLAGDWLYGTENQDLIKRPALHSCFLQLKHPLTGALLEFNLPLPQDMEKILKDDSN